MLWPSAAPLRGSARWMKAMAPRWQAPKVPACSACSSDQRRQLGGEGHADPAHHARRPRPSADQADDADPLHQPAARQHQQDLDGDALAPQQADGDVVDAGGAPGERAEAVEHGMARLAEAGGDHEQQERPGAQQVEDAERRVLAARVQGLGGRRQPERQREQQDDASQADIEHPGRAVAVDGEAAEQRAGNEGDRAPDAQACRS